MMLAASDFWRHTKVSKRKKRPTEGDFHFRKIPGGCKL